MPGMTMIEQEQEEREETEFSLLDTLKAQISPVLSEDTMAEAGRKALLVNLVQMLEHEAGSRTGEDIEDVHKMRVATRRMRSAFRLFEVYYKPKAIIDLVNGLKNTARYLGAVRDLDVMIHDLEKYASTAPPELQEGLQGVITGLDKRRSKARGRLVNYLDSDDYLQFARGLAKFVSKPGKGALSVDEDSPTPFQVRHVIPTVLHGHLAEVRAYDNVLAEASPETLHDLRIVCKRLRYATAFFTDVLGKTSVDFIEEVKLIQDQLGHLNDVVVAEGILRRLKPNEAQSAAIKTYLAHLTKHHEKTLDGFEEVWQRFNSRAVQGKISNALLTLK